MPQPNLDDPAAIDDRHKLLGLDHLRAFAIVYVLLFHYKFFGHPAWEVPIGVFGWTGVDLFFVLSGFLIAGQLFAGVAKGKPIAAREFFVKRFFRIIPPYFLVLILYFSFSALSEWGNLSPAWRYFTFTLNFGLDLRKYSTFSHAWSLCVEEQFYLVLPLCFWLFTRYNLGKKAWILLVALFIGGFVIRIYCWNHFVAPQVSDNLRPLWNLYVYYPTYNRLDGLLVGVSIAGLFTFYPKVKAWVNRYSNLLILAGIAGLFGGYLLCLEKESFIAGTYGFPVISVAYGLIVAAAVCPNNVLYKFKSVVTSQLAALSYSIYLVHKIVIHVTQVQLSNLGMNKDSGVIMVCCFIAVVFAALLMRYLVEMPVLKLRNRVLNKWKSRKEIVTPALADS